MQMRSASRLLSTKPSATKETLIMMKSNRLFAAAALIGAISFSMPLVANAQDNAVESGAKEMYHGTKNRSDRHGDHDQGQDRP
jgi:hypothetical protein